MNRTWGYNLQDHNFKSTEALIRYLVKAAGNNSNLLLNVGPRPNGEIPEESVKRLQEVGEWMKVYGNTIYGTRAGLIAPHHWGVTTQKGNILYVHILDAQDNVLYLPLQGVKVKKASVYKNGKPVIFRQDKDGVTLKLQEIPTDIDYVVEMLL